MSSSRAIAIVTIGSMAFTPAVERAGAGLVLELLAGSDDISDIAASDWGQPLDREEIIESPSSRLAAVIVTSLASSGGKSQAKATTDKRMARPRHALRHAGRRQHDHNPNRQDIIGVRQSQPRQLSKRFQIDVDPPKPGNAPARVIAVRRSSSLVRPERASAAALFGLA